MASASTGKASGSHRSLIVWQEAMNMVEMVYRVTGRFPQEEMYGLSSQLRRSAVSVPSNIAEGAGRNSTRELLQFIGVASGSLAELDTQLEIAARLGYLNKDAEPIQHASRVGQLLVALRRSLRDRA